MREPNYIVNKVNRFQIKELLTVASILHACGKQMADKYGLHHWDNPFLKTFLIVLISAFRNDIYILYSENIALATFMVCHDEGVLKFEKLATEPSYHGKGIGSFCISYIENIAKCTGCTRIQMDVYAPSHHAIDFYNKKGFVVVGSKNTLKYNELIMEKCI